MHRLFSVGATQANGGVDSMWSCATGITTLYSGDPLLPASSSCVGPNGSATYANMLLIEPAAGGVHDTGSLSALPLVAPPGSAPVACTGVGVHYRTLQTSRAAALSGAYVCSGGVPVHMPLVQMQMGAPMGLPMGFEYLQPYPPASLAYSPSLPLPNALQMHPQPQFNCFKPIATRTRRA